MTDRTIYDRVLVHIRPDQNKKVREDADDRYPEPHGTAGRRRNFSPALRDILDFWDAHRDIFLRWIATRDNLPPKV